VNIEISKLVIHLENPLGNLLLFVFLIALTVVGYFYMVRLREKRATAFGNIHTIERVQGFRRYAPSNIVLIMKILMILLIFMAATQSVDLRQKKPVTNTDYLLLIDSSGSMAQNDFPPTRLAAAKQLSRNWLNEVPNSTQVGVVSFSSTVESYVPLTTDKEVLLAAVDGIEIDYSHAGTSMDYALNFALESLNESKRNKTILLFTDGTQGFDPTIISRARQLSVPVIAFGIGAKSNRLSNRTMPKDYEEYYDVLSLNFTILENLANQTGGKAYGVSSISELQKSFNLATLQETQVRLNTNYYVLIFIALLSIAEMLIYSREGAL
jgi:Ca-activated chloride channel family protein